MKRLPSPNYDPLSRAFHWLTAIVVAVAFFLGPEDFGSMVNSGVDPATQIDIVWHETLGVLVVGLTLLRLLWLAFRPAAPQVATAGAAQLTAKLVHLGLWAMLLATPISAVLALGGASHPLTLLGGVRVDQMPWVAHALVTKLVDWGEVHKFLGDAIMWLAGLHAAAAIFHHLVLKDRVLLTMLPLKVLRQSGV